MEHKNGNSELSAHGKIKSWYLFKFYSTFQILELTLFQHLINPDSIIGASSVVLSNDDYLPDLVGEVEPDGNEIR